jgi:hypothetical protein
MQRPEAPYARGTVSITQDIKFPALVCPDVAANLVSVLQISNASPCIDIAIQAALTGQRVVLLAHNLLLAIPERDNILSLLLATGVGLLDQPSAGYIYPNHQYSLNSTFPPASFTTLPLSTPPGPRCSVCRTQTQHSSGFIRVLTRRIQ